MNCMNMHALANFKLKIFGNYPNVSKLHSQRNYSRLIQVSFALQLAI